MLSLISEIFTAVTFKQFTTFGTPFVIKPHSQTHTSSSIFTNTLSRRAFPSNQFATLLSETYFNVPVLFLLPLLFNTLLYYPLISPSLLSPSFLFPLYLLWAFGGSLAVDLHIMLSDSSRQVIWETRTHRKQLNKQHRLLQTTTHDNTHTHPPLPRESCTCMSIRVEIDVVFSSDVIGQTLEIIEMLHTTCTAALSACVWEWER